MNALLKKEIRLLLPSWIVALSLAVVPMWLVKNLDNFGGWGFFVLLAWLGTIALALESFGRELSPGVFSFFMSQPEERKHLWRVKVTTLAATTISVLCAFYVSLDLRQLAPLQLTKTNIDDVVLLNLQTLPVLALTAFAGGLWSTLLLRQTVAAMWFVILPPIGIAMSMAWLLPENPFFHTFDSVYFDSVYQLPEKSSHIFDSFFISVALIIYSVASYLFARRLFFRAQEVGWTGGTISFSTWKYFDAGEKSSGKRKKRGAIAALFAKELQLHSVSLFCAAGLLALNIIAILLRPYLARKHPVGELASNGFCLLWLMMPVIIGGMAVAEERKLGVMESLLCLPASRRLQFAVKFFMAMFFGMLFGGVMPLVLEKIAAFFGVPNGIFDANGDHSLQNNWFIAAVVIATMMLTFVAFFASTLSRNFLQAVGIAVATALGCGLFFAFIVFVVEHNTTFFGITPWHSALPVLIAVPVIVATLFWLAWLNFKTIHEDRRMWWRNIFWISGALIFIVVSSTVIYNRAWEIFEPAEPPHGAAKFSFSDPPKLSAGYYDNLLVQFPDGRVWTDNLSEPVFANNSGRWQELLEFSLRPLPASVGPKQFIGGSSSSNWISTSSAYMDWWESGGHVTGYLDTAGIRSDGTLWISEKSEPKVWTGANMVQFGDETNWRQIVRANRDFLLLKNDGTLWSWGTNQFDWSGWRTNWPSVRAFQPQQIGTNSDWKEISPVWWMRCAEKTDGTVWRIDEYAKNVKDEFSRFTNWDGVNLKTFSSENNASAYVGEDGTLWIRNLYLDKTENNWDWKGEGFLQVGKETNWLAVSVSWNSMIALKSDGSLWRWNFPADSPRDAAKIPPTRLGIHDDWIALTSILGGSVSLAADGSLWFWPGGEFYEGALLKNPKQPEFLGNVFENGN